MNNPTKPRPTDVARWVAICAAPLPDYFLRADYRAAVGEQSRARGQLASWGLDEHGAPRFAFLAPAVSP
jgi:hypothetical protein